MRQIEIQSNTYNYIIIRDMAIRPMDKGEIDVDILILSELRSLENLYIRKMIFISEIDANYIKNKISELSCECEEGGGPIGDYIPLNQKGIPNGVATLDLDGFVPKSQLNIPSSSEPFVVTDWDAFNSSTTEISSQLSANVEEIKITDTKSKIIYKDLPPEEKYLTNTFFTSSQNLTYSVGILEYTGRVLEDPPLPLIGFNNIKDIRSGVINKNSKNKVTYQLLITQEGDPSKILTGSSIYPYLRNTVTKDGNIRIGIKGEGESTLPLGSSTFFEVKNENNGVFQLIINQTSARYDLSNKENYNPDLPWNAFFIILEDVNSSTGEYFEKFEIEVTRATSNLFGGKGFSSVPEDFTITIDPLPENNPYAFALLFSPKESSTPDSFESGLMIQLAPVNDIVSISETITVGYEEHFNYDSKKPLTIEVEGSKNQIKILEHVFQIDPSYWSSFGIYWLNFSNTTVLPNFVEMVFDLKGFVKEIEIESVLPIGIEDGDVLRLTSPGLFNNNRLNIGDFVTVFNNQTELIITRLPSLETSDVETFSDFKILAIEAEYKDYVESSINDLKSTYRGRFFSEKNIYVEEPIDGDYILIGGNGSVLVTYFYNNINKSWEKVSTDSNLTSDNIPEGLYNKYFREELLHKILFNLGVLNVSNIESKMILGEIKPTGLFENNSNKTNNISNQEDADHYYPTVFAVKEYVNNKIKKSSLKGLDYFNLSINSETKQTKIKGEYFDSINDESTYEPLSPNFKINKKLSYTDGDKTKFLVDVPEGFYLDLSFYLLNSDRLEDYNYKLGIKFGEELNNQLEDLNIGVIYFSATEKERSLNIKGISSVSQNIFYKKNSNDFQLFNFSLYFDGTDLKIYTRDENNKKFLVETLIDFNVNYLDNKIPTYLTIFGEDLSETKRDIVKRIDLSFIPMVEVDL